MRWGLSLTAFIVFGCSNEPLGDDLASYLEETNPRGVFLAYFDPANDCRLCYGEIFEWERLRMAYPDLQLVFVYRNASGALGLEGFKSFCKNNNLVGRTFWDKDEIIGKSFGLADSPYFVCLDRRLETIFVSRMSPSLNQSPRFYHQLIQEM